MTALDLISASMRVIGVLASGETLNDNEANDALNSLNDYIDSLSTQNLLIPNKIREVFTLVAGTQTYTFGAGGNFNSSRPMKIENALISPLVSPEIELPMTILNMREWSNILIKSIGSTIPLYVYNDNNYPLSNINLWPIPQDTSSLVLYSWKPLTDFSSLTSVVSLPPGYNRMLRFNFALELAPEYGKMPDQVAMALAIQSMENVKRMNITPSIMHSDAGALGSGSAFNWLTGEES